MHTKTIQFFIIKKNNIYNYKKYLNIDQFFTHKESKKAEKEMIKSVQDPFMCLSAKKHQ